MLPNSGISLRDIPEEKDLSGIRYGTSVQKPIIQFVNTMANSQVIWCVEVCTIQNTLGWRNKNIFLTWPKHAVSVKMKMSTFIRLLEE